MNNFPYEGGVHGQLFTAASNGSVEMIARGAVDEYLDSLERAFGKATAEDTLANLQALLQATVAVIAECRADNGLVMTKATMRHTPGVWRTEKKDPSTVTMDGQVVATAIAPDGASYEEQIANAALIIEAGNVANETGLTPRLLSEQRTELVETVIGLRGALRRFMPQLPPDVEAIDCGEWIEAASEVIAKVGAGASKVPARGPGMR